MNNPNTLLEYKEIIKECQELFKKKNEDYGSAWRILRLPSLTDQLFIKAKRIRTIQENGIQKIADDVRGEFIAMINYCVIALIQIQLKEDERMDISTQEINTYYSQIIDKNWELLSNKNHDYGEAWREMRISSMTDLILMKLLRIKQIEDNKGKTIASEGVESNYQDILNYSVFCLIQEKTN
jgi:hypothetical protein